MSVNCLLNDTDGFRINLQTREKGAKNLSGPKKC